MQSDVFAEKILSSAADHGQSFWQSVYTTIIAICKDKIVICPDREDLTDKVIAEIRQVLQEESSQEIKFSENRLERNIHPSKENIPPGPWEHKGGPPKSNPLFPGSFLR
jgi:hypothetical protein